MMEKSWKGDCAGKKTEIPKTISGFHRVCMGVRGKQKKFTVPVNPVPADVKAPFEE